MGRVIMNAAVSLDGFIAYDDDTVGPMFDFYGNGDVPFSFTDGVLLENPRQVVEGDRVLHLLYDVRR